MRFADKTSLDVAKIGPHMAKLVLDVAQIGPNVVRIGLNVEEIDPDVAHIKPNDSNWPRCGPKLLYIFFYSTVLIVLGSIYKYCKKSS